MKDFVHLHLHSEYSLLDGACRVKDIPRAAKAAGQRAVAITDHGVMYGVVSFYKACVEEGIKPIIGCEVYVAQGSRFDKKRTPDYFNCHLTLLVKNEIGYKNLIKMVSSSFTEGFYVKPRIDDELLAGHSEGLVCLSGCLSGHMNRALLKGDEEEAREYAKRMISYFGKENFFVELQDNGVPEQKMLNATLARIAKELGVGVVATNDVHYIRKRDADIQAVLTCIQTNTRIADGRPLGFEKDEFYLKSTEEMDALLGKYDGAIENTAKIADMCSFDFTFGKNHLPVYDVPEGYTASRYLAKLAEEGLENRINNGSLVFDDKHQKEDYVMRYKYELMIIAKMGYSEYYLIVWDFVSNAKKRGITVGPGRGSGAGSLVAYLIGITDVDSIKHNLLFERFLNPERISMPDFDIDFRDDMREDAIKYVTEKYGKDRVSQIITFGTMAARAAIRDVGRALGMPYAEVDRVAKAVPQKAGITIERAMEGELAEIYNEDPSVRRLIDTARELEGFPRHASVHAAGVLITEKELDTYVPLATSGDTVVAQFDMDTVASLGLLKFDFLAVRYLTVISNAEKAIKIKESTFDIEKVGFDDKKTYSLISEGDTVGLFQLESGGMKRMLSQMKPENLSDIILAISIYRPGPMESIPLYLENRKDPSKIKYKVESLKDILDETFGVIVYQEQVMQICRRVANFSYGKADVVRRAMSKKKSEAMEKERADFLKGAKDNFIDEKTASELFDEMAGFAKYAFNKSHAAAYAVTSYRTAYLKANYPAQYFAALLSAFGESPVYIADAKKHGVLMLSPDVNSSEAGFTVAGGNIRYGLLGIKGIGRGIADAIVREGHNKPFLGISDFIERMLAYDITKQQITALIAVGAFDSFGVYRNKMMVSFERIYSAAEQKAKNTISGQIDMFAAFSDDDSINKPPELEDVPEYSRRELMALEKEYMGVYISGSLLDEYSESIKRINYTDISEFAFASDSEETETESAVSEKNQYTVVGIVRKIVRKNTKNGAVMAFVSLEDRAAEMEIIVFPKLYEKKGMLLNVDSAISVVGNPSIREDEPMKLLAADFELLPNNSELRRREEQEKALELAGMSKGVNSYSTKPKAPVNSTNTNLSSKQVSKLYIKVPSLGSSEYKQSFAVLEIFEEGGDAEVIFYDESKKEYIRSGRRMCTSEAIISYLKKICGNDSVIPK